jgi:hypothetical protein
VYTDLLRLSIEESGRFRPVVAGGFLAGDCDYEVIGADLGHRPLTFSGHQESQTTRPT